MKFRWFAVLPLALLAGCSQAPQIEITQKDLEQREPVPHSAQKELSSQENKKMSDEKIITEEKVVKSDEEWRKTLTPQQYHILREKGTEVSFTGKYWNLKEDGSYVCAGCGQVLFTSETKFDSGCGWPSFYEAVDKTKVKLQDDFSHGMQRIEVVCSRCGGHLGHVFDDGPNPTGKRFCINSGSLNFKKK